MCSRWSCGGCSSQKQGDGAVHQQQGHDRVHRPGVPGEQKAEHRPEGRPGQGEYKPDEGQQQGKEQQYGRLSAIAGEDIGLHGHDAVEVNFGVDELEEQAGPEPLPGVCLLDRAGAAEGAPGQIEHIGRPQHQHGQPDGGDQGGQSSAEQGAQRHHNGKSHPDAQVEGQGPPEAQPPGVGHGHNVVGTRGSGGNHRVGEEGVPGKHVA